MNLASSRTDMEFELLDLREYDLPFFDEVASNAFAPTQSDAGRKWQLSSPVRRLRYHYGRI